MAELLFEIFCEEIPARMQVRAGQDLEKAMTTGLNAAGLSVDDVRVFTGPRRLVYVADIPLQSPDIEEERKGPRVGSPQQALAGFLRGAGLTDISQAETRSDKKGEHYVAVIKKEGVSSHEILSDLIPNIMNKFPWPKSMKSGESAFRWVRPLQSMICLLNEVVVLVEVGGVTAGNVTEGHRRHGAGPFTVTNFENYKSVLEGEGHVILDAKEREALILRDAKAACEAKGLELVEDAGLLSEVAGLAEWPVVILGKMDPSFLELPSEVIRLSMRTHQKYFAVRKAETGQLAPNFIVVANQSAPDGGAAIAQGNSRVLSARLADAQFFQSEDAKKNLIEYYDKLDTVVFHKKLGSIRDKAERVSALAKAIAPKVGADAELAAHAAKLAKCDLVTQTVIEFTSLQGQIGRLMYERALRDAAIAAPQGEVSAKPHPKDGVAVDSKSHPEGGVAVDSKPHPEDGVAVDSKERKLSAEDHASIAVAIEDHYKPQGPSDSVPTDPVAIAVALADKVDSLVGFWAIDEKPTGSKDPFALRRAALGIVRIVLENDKRLKISAFIDFTRDHFPSSLSSEDNLIAFILDRLKTYLRDQGLRHDVIDSVYAQNNSTRGGDDLVDIVNRIKAVQAFIDSQDGANLLAGYKRAANILKAEQKKGALPDGRARAPHEAKSRALFTALQSTDGTIDARLQAEDYVGAMAALAGLRRPIDEFFMDVQVIADDTAVKENNLRLLKDIRDTAQKIANFDLISG